MPRRRVPSPSGKALYRVLAPGRPGVSAEQAALHQRSRLHGAIVTAVAASGYSATTVGQVVSLAGVSRSTFYKHFADKQACFLSTYDVIAAMATERITRAYRTPADPQARLRAGFQRFAQIIMQEPAAAHLVLVDALGVGHPVLPHRERMTATFELMLAQSFQAAPEQAHVTDTTIKAIIAGIRRVAYRRLLHGHPEQVSEIVDDLLAWALSYHAPGVEPPQRAAIGAAGSRAPQQTPKDSVIKTPKHPDRALHQDTPGAQPSHRELILHAVISLAGEGGYGALSIPAISARAHISNKTFYANFADKQQAFLTAFDQSTSRALQITGRSFRAAPDWPSAVKAAITALLDLIIEDHAFAHLAFFAILTGGPAAIQAAEQSLDSVQAMLAPGHQQHPEVPAVISEAIIGGIWNVIQYELGHDRTEQLPGLAGELTYIALVPFLGAKEAAEIATAVR
jgi:AcrR family transcriptional regulator